jgi:hypothetical protein
MYNNHSQFIGEETEANNSLKLVSCRAWTLKLRGMQYETTKAKQTKTQSSPKIMFLSVNIYIFLPFLLSVSLSLSPPNAVPHSLPLLLYFIVLVNKFRVSGILDMCLTN